MQPILRTEYDRANLREVVRMSVPIIFSMASISMMGLVDTFFMGMIGPAEQAAVGSGANLVFFFLSFFLGIFSGLTTFTAQFCGSSEFKKCGYYLHQSFYLAIPTAIIIFFVVIPSVRPVLELFGTNKNIIGITESYIHIRLYASVWLIPGFILVCFLRGIGDMLSTAIVTFVALMLNIPFTYALSFGIEGWIPALGADGAAYGTILAHVIETILYLLIIFGKKNAKIYHTRQLLKPDFASLRHYLSVAFPIGASWILEQVGWIYAMLFVMTLPEVEVAAHNIASQIFGLALMPGIAISIATSTLVGQYLGANNPNAAMHSAKYSIRFAVSLLFGIGVILLMLRDPICRSFNPDPEVQGIASRLFFFAVAYQIFDATALVSGGAMRGAGDTRWPMCMTIILMWLILIPGTYVVGKVMGFGLYGTWSVVTAYIVTSGIIFYIRFIRGKWKNVRV